MELSQDHEVMKKNRYEWITWIEDKVTITTNQHTAFLWTVYIGHHIATPIYNHTNRNVACDGVICNFYGHGHGILLHILAHFYGDPSDIIGLMINMKGTDMNNCIVSCHDKTSGITSSYSNGRPRFLSDSCYTHDA